MCSMNILGYKCFKKIRRPMFYNGSLSWALTSCKNVLHRSMCSVNVTSIDGLCHSIKYRGVNERFAFRIWAVNMFPQESAPLTHLFTAMTTTFIESKNMNWWITCRDVTRPLIRGGVFIHILMFCPTDFF